MRCKIEYAPVAQLDRALDSDSKGRWFESSRAYQKPLNYVQGLSSFKEQSHTTPLLMRYYCRSSKLNTRVNRATVSIIPMTMK